MNRKLANLTVSKQENHYDKVIKALEDAGFVIVLAMETTTDRYYIVAEKEVELSYGGLECREKSI